MIRNAFRSKLNILNILVAMTMVLTFAVDSEVFAAHGASAPNLEDTYAASEISPHETWQIYLKGSDPNGDLKFIHVWVNVPGVPTTPTRLRIDRDQGGNVSGYLTLSDFGSGAISDLFGPPIILWVTLEDRAGNRSETVELPLSFYLGAKRTEPREDFDDRLLGRIPGISFGRGIGL